MLDKNRPRTKFANAKVVPWTILADENGPTWTAFVGQERSYPEKKNWYTLTISDRQKWSYRDPFSPKHESIFFLLEPGSERSDICTFIEYVACKVEATCTFGTKHTVYHATCTCTALDCIITCRFLDTCVCLELLPPVFEYYRVR